MADFSGKPLISARQGQNLFDLFNNVTLNHISIRNSQFDMEVALNGDLIKTHTAFPMGVVFKNVSHPICILEKQSEMENVSDFQFGVGRRVLLMLNRLS